MGLTGERVLLGKIFIFSWQTYCMMPTKLLEHEVAPHDGKVDLDKGFFVLHVDHSAKKIVAEYFVRAETEGKTTTSRSGKLRMIFKGRRGPDVYRAILKHDFVGRAERCLESGEEYVQDGGKAEK